MAFLLPGYGTPLNLHMIPLDLEVRYVMHFGLIDSSAIYHIQIRISPVSAMISTSVGVRQIMGRHHLQDTDNHIRMAADHRRTTSYILVTAVDHGT